MRVKGIQTGVFFNSSSFRKKFWELTHNKKKTAFENNNNFFQNNFSLDLINIFKKSIQIFMKI